METGTHPHLLIIEDDVLLNDMTKRLLTQHGYCVTSAYSGSEALLLIEKGTFDLILLDLMLPGIPGETVLEYRLSEGAPPDWVCTTKACDNRLSVTC